MNIKFAFVLDKPSQIMNKGSNVIYLGDFELCNAGDRSARIYVGDSNGDVIEIDDILDKEFEEFKKKILKVSKDKEISDIKPFLLYRIGADEGFSKANMLDLYNKSKSEDIKPYTLESQVLGINHKLHPFISDKTVFGKISGDSMEDLMSIFVGLANEILKAANLIFTTLLNLSDRVLKELSKFHKDISESFNKLNEIVVRLLGYIVLCESLENKYNEFKASQLEELKTVVVTDFQGYGSSDASNKNNYSTMDLIATKGAQEDINMTPFVDIIVSAHTDVNGSLVGTCSFRLDKKSRIITNFTGDITYFQPTRASSGNYYTLPLYVKNSKVYKVTSNWSFSVSCNRMMTSTPTNTSSDSLLFTNVIDYMDISNLILESSSDGRFVKFRLTVESEDSRWLRIYDAINNSEIMSFRTELLRPQDYGGRVLMIRQESLVGYFKLGTSYSKNGLQPIIIDARNDTRYMIQHDIERLVQLGQMNHIYTSTLSGRHSSGADGSMPGIKDTGVGIFQGYIEITVDWIMNGGDFDSHGYEFWIYNRDDRSRVVHKKFHFDYGSNYGFTKNTYKYVLTSSEVAQLGGRNTSLAFQGRIRYDSGSGGSDVCRGEFYITTK